MLQILRYTISKTKKIIMGYHGMALMITLIMMLFLLPATLTLLYISTRHQETTTKERQIRTARSLANTVLVDLMRQFSQNTYEDRYNLDYTNRTDSFYRLGFSSVTILTDSMNHCINVVASGKYGQNIDHPLFQKRLFATIQFMSPWTEFSSISPGDATASGSNAVTYGGKSWTGGNLSYDNTCSIVKYGGPIFVAGNVTAYYPTTFYCDLYCGGTISGTFIKRGKVFNFVPDFEYPTIKMDYYKIHYNYKITTNSELLFNADGTFTIVGGETVTIPVTGMIIYAENCNITISGTVRGRVTIVANGTGTTGIVTIKNNLVYANGTNNASELDSLAILTNNTISFTKGVANMVVCGILISSNVKSFTFSWSVSGGTFKTYGCRNQGLDFSGYAPMPIRTYNYDPYLNKYPPPGLPEKPYLVSWHVE